MKIKINDKEYGLSWGMGALRLFCDAMECELDDGFEMVLNAGEYTVLQRAKAVATLVVCAARNYALVNRQEQPDITTWDVELYRDEQFEAFKLITSDFLNSTLQGETIANRFGIETQTETDLEVKKKPVKKLASVKK